MERKTLARLLVVAALACFGLLWASAALAETTVQGTQSSDGSTANTGAATGNNTSAFTGGPTATGTTNANATQNGSNTSSVNQSGSASTGDPVAGAQVTGVVGDDVTVQNTNNAIDPFAESGTATLTNVSASTLGPQAVADNAQASQIGDNSSDTVQDSSATTGDAVAGAQVTGIVGDGEHVVQNSNTADCGLGLCALSGDALVISQATATTGPLAVATTLAQAGQVGDNDATLSQSTVGRTGDALNGAQVSGIVGGSATVQNSNNSTTSGAESGAVTALNLGFATIVGPNALSGGDAQSQQTGDNAVEIDQSVESATGDAVAGAQVTGAVGDEGGFFTVQNQQASEDDVSVSGDNVTLNQAASIAGPQALAVDNADTQQNGDNDVTTDQAADASTGDALAGSQVTGDVGHSDVTVQQSNTATTPTAVSGTINAGGAAVNVAVASAGPLSIADTATAQQLGENGTAADQSVQAATGDAVAGGQITGVVASGSTVVVQNTNASDGSTSVSGDVTGTALNSADLVSGPNAIGTTSATATQSGDNEADAAQDATAATGDAVAGGQVTGIVDEDGAEITVQNSNTSLDDVAVSGAVSVTDANLATAFAGALADADTATATQSGDNAAAVDQAADLSTGDAVGGAQVTGVVSGDDSDVTIQNTNNADTPTSVSGEVDADNVNDAIATAGTVAVAASTDATASQIGDNAVDVAQDAAAATGDAVAGAQVTGGVVGDDSTVTVQNSNTAVSAVGVSGSLDDFTAVNAAATAAGANAVAQGDATASQTGDNAVALDQAADAATGDAVAGAQVTGLVAGDDADLTVQNTNNDDASTAVSGAVDAVIFNDAAVVAGAVADGGGNATAQQLGDNDADASQSLTAATGDAVAGAQVTGTVAGDGSSTTIQQSVTADDSVAVSGTVAGGATDGNFVAATAGAAAFAATTGTATQTGDNGIATDQDVNLGTGDAVAGAQVTGSVSGDDSTVEIQNSSVGDTVTAVSGSVGNTDFAANAAQLQAGTNAFGSTSTQNGDNSVDATQSATAATGDAVSAAQVTGAVAGDDSDVTVQNANSSVGGNVAVSGDVDVDVANDLVVAAGPASDGVGNSTATQIGDNAVAADQALSAATGDAVAGAQVTGVVAGDDSNVSQQGSNSAADGDTAVSGSVTADVANAFAPIGQTVTGPDAGLLAAVATATQTGDNSVDVAQSADAATGDAVGAAQVVGIVVGDDSTVESQNTNTAVDGVAVSGTVDFATAGNSADLAGVGPAATSNAGAATASQIGDNDASVDQDLSAATGDAVSGSQVAGAVAGDGSDVTIQNSNNSTDNTAVSGDVDGATNVLAVTALGPQADAAGVVGNASATQSGDNSLDFAQAVDASTGDAVAGSQVTGIVGPEDATSQVSNTDSGSVAVAGGSTTVNVAAGSISPVATSAGGTANATQNGDSGFDGEQSLSSDNGDALAGAQVSGDVGA